MHERRWDGALHFCRDWASTRTKYQWHNRRNHGYADRFGDLLRNSHGYGQRDANETDGLRSRFDFHNSRQANDQLQCRFRRRWRGLFGRLFGKWRDSAVQLDRERITFDTLHRLGRCNLGDADNIRFLLSDSDCQRRRETNESDRYANVHDQHQPATAHH